MLYDAFVSYSHAADDELAPALQSALHRFAKPWYRLRAVRIFRDKTSLAVSPALWPAIETALADSNYFILLASPESAASHWVQQEIDFWIRNRSTDTLLIILTDGELGWSENAGDFDWNLTTALPDDLRGIFLQEPLYLDLRWAKEKEHLSLANPMFREAVAELAATLQGKAKDEMIGEDVRRHKRTKQVTFSAILTLATFAFLAAWQAYTATKQRNIAEQRTRMVSSQLIANRSQSVVEEYPIRGLVLAVEALRVTQRAEKNEPHTSAAEVALREALANVGGRGLGWYEHGNSSFKLSSKGRWLATRGKKNGAILLWDLSVAEPTSSPIVLIAQEKVLSSFAISPKEDWIATLSGDKTVYLWDLRSNDPAENPKILNSTDRKMTDVQFSPGGRWLIATSYNGPVLIWDLSSRLLGETARIIPTHGRFRAEIDISGDDRWLVLSSDNLATVWDLANPDRPVINIKASKGDIDIEISPDGRWLATRSETHAVRLWDLSLEEPGRNPFELKGHLKRPKRAQFSPESDRLITLSEDTIRVWNLRARDPATDPVVLTYDNNLFVGFAISPDGHKLTGYTTRGTLFTWDLENPSESPIQRISPLRSPRYPRYSHSPNGDWLMMTSSKGVLLWYRTHQKALVFPGDKAVLSSGDRWLVTASSDNTIRVFELTDEYSVKDGLVMRGHEANITGMSISEDNRWLITRGDDWTIRLWRLDGSDTPASPLTLRGHESRIKTIAVSPDSKWLLTEDDAEVALLWKLDTGYPGESIKLTTHRGDFKTAVFSPKSRWLVTGARLWDLQAEDPAKHSLVLSGHGNRISAVAFSPDEDYLATGSVNPARPVTSSVRIWDLRSSNIAASSTLLGKHRGPIFAMSFSGDNRWLLTRSEGKNARLWDLGAPNVDKEPILVPHQKENIRSVAISPDSKWIVARADDKSALLWDLETMTTHTEPIGLPSYEPKSSEQADEGFSYLTMTQGHDIVISTVAFTPDNRWLVTCGHENTASLWNLTSNKPASNRIILEGHTKKIAAVAISPDGRWLATGSSDRTAALWRLDVKDPAAEPIFLHGHEGPVFDVTISADNRWLLTRSDDKTARLWDLKAEDPAKNPVIIKGHDKIIHFASFSSDGRWLIIGDESTKEMQLWPLKLDDLMQYARRAAGRNLTINEWGFYLSEQDYEETFSGFLWPSGPGSGVSGR